MTASSAAATNKVNAPLVRALYRNFLRGARHITKSQLPFLQLQVREEGTTTTTTTMTINIHPLPSALPAMKRSQNPPSKALYGSLQTITTETDEQLLSKYFPPYLPVRLKSTAIPGEVSSSSSGRSSSSSSGGGGCDYDDAADDDNDDDPTSSSCSSSSTCFTTITTATTTRTTTTTTAATT